MADIVADVVYVWAAGTLHDFLHNPQKCVDFWEAYKALRMSALLLQKEIWHIMVLWNWYG